jgi:hypothetical protein
MHASQIARCGHWLHNAYLFKSIIIEYGMNFKILLEKDEDGWYVATVPGLL